MRRFILSCFLLAILYFVADAQSHGISGKVIDSQSMKPVYNVQVQDAKSSRGGVTGLQGEFFIQPEGTFPHTLIFSHIGYQTLSKTFTESDSVSNRVIFLVPHARELQEVEIMGVSVNNKPYRTEVIDVATMERSNLQDVGALLRTVPNVNGIRKGAMGIDPVVRGFKYAQLNVQVNGGTRIEGGCPNRMDPATAHVDFSDLKNIAIIKGPFALKYGVNFGGVIDLTTYRPTFYDQHQTHVKVLLGGQTNHSGFKTKVGVDGGNRLITYNISGSWKQYGDYKSGKDKIIPASLTYQSLSGMLGFKIAEKHMVFADADISQGSNIDFPALPMDERIDDTKIFSLNYLTGDLGPAINFIRMKAYVSDVRHEMDNKNRPFSDTVVAISKIHARNSGVKFGVNFMAGKAAMEVGGDYEHIYKDGNREKFLIMQPLLPVKNESLWNRAMIQNLGVFAEYRRPATALEWIVSLRLDVNDAVSDPLLWTAMNSDVVYQNSNTKSQYTNISFSGGLTWHVADNSEITASAGRGARSPDMTERYIILLPVGYDRYDYLGNPQLLPEVNHEIDLGYRLNLAAIGSIEASGFFSYVTNFISAAVLPPSEMKPQTKGVLGVKKFINIDHAYLTGFEFSWSTPVQKLWLIHLNAAYTMGWNPEAIKYIYQDGQVVDEQIVKNDPLPEIPPLELNLIFSYQFFKQKLVPSVRLRYAAAQNRISQTYGEQSTPAFFNLGLDLRYMFSKNLTVYAGVNNVLNTAYYEHLNRRIIGSGVPLYEAGRVFYANLIFKL